mgnify:CR=1 FL=1
MKGSDRISSIISPFTYCTGDTTQRSIHLHIITANNSSYGRHSLSSSSQYNTQSFIRRLTKEVKDTANTLRLWFVVFWICIGCFSSVSDQWDKTQTQTHDTPGISSNERGKERFCYIVSFRRSTLWLVKSWAFSCFYHGPLQKGGKAEEWEEVTPF